METTNIIEMSNSDLTEVDLDLFRNYVERLLTVLDLAEAVELYVNFVGEDEIRELNEKYLNHEGPTDVLSFPIEPPDYFIDRFGILSNADFHKKINGHLLLGDIYICPTYVLGELSELGVDFKDEMALLLVHGLLHLMGLDHEDEMEAEFMETLEQDLIKKCLA